MVFFFNMARRMFAPTNLTRKKEQNIEACSLSLEEPGREQRIYNCIFECVSL